METNFAFTSGETKLFPLCYTNEDGSIDRAKTVELVDAAIMTFVDVASVHIPAPERASVLNQIKGAAISLGLLT